MKSHLEHNVELRLKAAGFPAPECEYKFSVARKFRFDFCWPKYQVAVEVEGGIFMRKGGHTSGKGYTSNCEKYNLATVMGWKVLRYPPNLFYMLVEDLRKLIPISRARK